MRKLTKKQAVAALKAILKDLRRDDAVMRTEVAGLTDCKFNLMHGGYVEIGFQRVEDTFRMFTHFKLPGSLQGMNSCKQYLERLVDKYPNIEVYFNENFQDDFNKGVRREEHTNRVVCKLKVKGAMNVFEQELRVLSGEEKYSALNYRRFDYDVYFQKIK